MKTIKRILFIICVLVMGIAIFISLQPKPIKVEAVCIDRGPMQVNIAAEGKTRVQNRFVVAAPVTGKLLRLNLHQGDYVTGNEILARIEPLPLAPLDIRQLTEAKAKVEAVEQQKKEAEVFVARVLASCEQAEREYKRAENLIKNGLISQQDFERIGNAKEVSQQELNAAKHRLNASIAEIEVAKATLIAAQHSQQSTKITPTLIFSPIAGKVLSVSQESERVVTAGTPLIEISNQKLEIVIDVLSTNAVKIKPGATIVITGWGGNKELKAQVRLIEPSAFTKISALGIEEQRVNTVADFLELPTGLGDGYHVEAKILVWEQHNVLKVPISSLFRNKDSWSVFVVENGIAKLRDVQIDHINDVEAEVISGLMEKEIVIIHPSNQISDGAKIVIDKILVKMLLHTLYLISHF